MEFHEKLQELRKRRGLTQEELAEILYVSRTAISKWESGRGYPSIDSLREISKFFSVTIDELLSSERIIHIAERENKANIHNICDLLFGITDLLNSLLVILPLYPRTTGDYVYSVSLFSQNDLTSVNRTVYWIMFVLLILIGTVKVIFNQAETEKARSILTNISVAVNIAAVLVLALTRQAYAIVISFVLLIIKSILVIKNK